MKKVIKYIVLTTVAVPAAIGDAILHALAVVSLFFGAAVRGFIVKFCLRVVGEDFEDVADEAVDMCGDMSSVCALYEKIIRYTFEKI